MSEVTRIKNELKKYNIKSRLSKYGLWIYTKYTTFFISNYDLELKGDFSRHHNDFLLNTVIDLTI